MMSPNLTIKAWLIYLTGLMSLLLVGAGGVGIGSLGAREAELKAVYDDRMAALGELQQVAGLIDSNQLAAAEWTAGQAAHASAADARIEAMKQDIARIDALWSAYLAKAKTAAEMRRVAAFAANRQRYERQGLLPAMAALRAHDFRQASDLLQGPMRETYPALRQNLKSLIALQRDAGKAELAAGTARNATVRGLAIGALLLGVLLAATIGTGLVRANTRPPGEGARAADDTGMPEAGPKGETGQQLAALAAMKSRLTDMLAQIRETSDVIGTVSREIAAVEPAAGVGDAPAGDALRNLTQGSEAAAATLGAQAARLAEASRFLRSERTKAASSSTGPAHRTGPNVVPLRPNLAPTDRLAGSCGGGNEWEAS